MSAHQRPLATARAVPDRWLVTALAVGAAVTVGAFAALPGLLAGWLVLGSVALALVLWRPATAVLLLPLAIGFGSLVPLQVGGLRAGPTDLLVGGLVLALLVREGWRLRTEPRAVPQRLADAARTLWREDPSRVTLCGALALYVLVIILSLAVATERTAVLKETLKWGEVLALVALVPTLLRRNPALLRALAWATVVAGVAEALLGYVQWVVGSGDLGPGGGDVRVFGTFAQPNPYAGFLVLCLPVAVALALRAADPRARWVAGAATTLMLGAEVLARSRGALLGLTVGLVVFGVLLLRRERVALLAGLVAVVVAGLAWVVGLVPISLRDRILALTQLDNAALCAHVNNGNFSTLERLAHWAAGLRMFGSAPLLGVGAGNYNAAYAHFNAPCWPDPLGHAHNYFITAAAETGALGLAAFLAVVVVAGVVGWRATRPLPAVAEEDAHARRRRLARQALAAGFVAALLGVLVHSLTDNLFVHAMELQVALSLAALVATLGARGRPQPTHVLS